MTTEPRSMPTDRPRPPALVSVEVIASIRAIVGDADLWDTEREDYEQQDPSQRNGHLFEHLLLVDQFLRQLSPSDHARTAGDKPVSPSDPVIPPPQHRTPKERRTAGPTITGAGIGYERVTDPHTLLPGEWVRLTKPLGDTDTLTLHLTVIEPHGRHQQGTGVLCHRHGRALMPTEQHIVLTQPVIELGQVHRATTQPPHGIPGTWCDSYDSNGDTCGRSLHHHGDCLTSTTADYNPPPPLAPRSSAGRQGSATSTHT